MIPVWNPPEELKRREQQWNETDIVSHFALWLRDQIKGSMSLKNGNFCQRGAGGLNPVLWLALCNLS